MKIYKVCFSTESYDGDRVFHYPMILVSKIRNQDRYKVKWNFSFDFDDPHNRSAIVRATDPIKAFRSFMWDELCVSSVDLVGWSEIKL